MYADHDSIPQTCRYMYSVVELCTSVIRWDHPSHAASGCVTMRRPTNTLLWVWRGTRRMTLFSERALSLCRVSMILFIRLIRAVQIYFLYQLMWWDGGLMFVTLWVIQGCNSLTVVYLITFLEILAIFNFFYCKNIKKSPGDYLS